MQRALITSIFLWLVLGAVHPLSAADVWTSPHPGIDYLHRTESGQVIHLAEIDLSEEAISIRVTRETEGWVVPSALAQSLSSAVTPSPQSRESCQLVRTASRERLPRCRASQFPHLLCTRAPRLHSGRLASRGCVGGLSALVWETLGPQC